MPLLTVPDRVPFIAVTKAVFAFRARAERHDIGADVADPACTHRRRGQPGRPAGHPRRAPRRDRAAQASSSTSSAGCWRKPIPTAAGSSNGCRDLLASVRDHGLAAAAADISDGRRRELHALGAQRLRAWLLIDGPAELPAAEQITGDLVSLLSLELERQARAQQRPAARTGAGARPAGQGHGGRCGRGSLAGVPRPEGRRPAGRRRLRPPTTPKTSPPTC